VTPILTKVTLVYGVMFFWFTHWTPSCVDMQVL